MSTMLTLTVLLALLCGVLHSVQGDCQHGGSTYAPGATWTFMAGTPMEQSCFCPGSGVASCTSSLNLGLAATTQPRCYDAWAIDSSSGGFYDPGRVWKTMKEEGVYDCCCPYEFAYGMSYQCVPEGTSTEPCSPTTSTTTTPTTTVTTTTEPPTTTTTEPFCIDPYSGNAVMAGDKWAFKAGGGSGGVCKCMVYPADNTGVLGAVCIDYGWKKGKNEKHNKAQDDCDKDGRRLVIVEDQQKLEALQIWLEAYGNHDFWIGGTDDKNEGSWMWEDKTSVVGPVTVVDWFPGSFPISKTPNGGTKENCILVTRKLDNGYQVPRHMWDDENCDKKNEGLCELENSIIITP